jgi:nascent polypeptide-associated complex subunit alpha
MIPGLGKINPKQMQAMMRQMGIAQEDIDAARVVIEKTDNSKIVIDNPSVQKIKMQGQESFQITGDAREESGSAFSEEDVKLVMEKTGKPEGEARSALEETGGDIAEAIVNLS